jgi:transcriptional regulator of acetoin/glycerol metabolism
MDYTLSAEESSISRAREEFLSGQDPRVALRDGLLASWRRSVLSGARPDVPTLPYSADVPKRGQLFEAAAPVLDRLTERFDGTRAAMLLADSQARIVARWVGEHDLLTTMDQTDSAPGFSLMEEFCGTNGLGSVLEERRAVAVIGPEHFAERFLVYACYGAPIRQQGTQRIDGILTFMCPARDASPLMMPFVQQTCEVIQGRLVAMSTRRYRALLDAYVTTLRSSRRAVLAISEQTVIVSSAASRLLGDVDPARLWDSAVAAVSGGGMREIVWPLDGERELDVRIRPVHAGGKLAGAVAELCLRPARAAAPHAEDPARLHPERLLLSRLGGTSKPWLYTLRQAARAVASRQPILITGEAGTGKLELARAIHEAGRSSRGDGGASGPGLKVLNAVLASVDGLAGWMGQVRALMSQPGTVVITHLETLEPGRAAALAALLDELLEGAPGRVIGTAVTGPAVALAGPHLTRLAIHRLTVPPLRDRQEDIPHLTARLLDRHGCRELRIGADALRALNKASWPGNIRQLDLLVRTLAAERGSGVVTTADLPAELLQTGRRTLTHLERLEMHAIVAAMRDAEGNKKLAAAELGISRSTLYRKLRTFHLDQEQPGSRSDPVFGLRN